MSNCPEQGPQWQIGQAAQGVGDVPVNVAVDDAVHEAVLSALETFDQQLDEAQFGTVDPVAVSQAQEEGQHQRVRKKHQQGQRASLEPTARACQQGQRSNDKGRGQVGKAEVAERYCERDHGQFQKGQALDDVIIACAHPEG